MKLKEKIIFGVLIMTLCLGVGVILITSTPEAGVINAGIYSSSETSSTNNLPLMCSYHFLEGMEGNTIGDFELSLNGVKVNNYDVASPTESFKRTSAGLELVNPGEGEATFSYKGESVVVAYNIQENPDLVKEEEGTQYSLTANGDVLSGAILYIDNSKNAFKVKGPFLLPESVMDGEKHTLYLAKFTKQGPVAYKITEFISMADEVNFMNYNESEVTVNNGIINLNHSAQGLL